MAQMAQLLWSSSIVVAHCIMGYNIQHIVQFFLKYKNERAVTNEEEMTR